ncbi:MAG: RNA polymerase sigma factor [Planctomycetaceae bacterium]
MKTTSVSLLQRLQAPSPSHADWRCLQDMYLPLIQYWLARVPGLGDEANDLAQEVLVVLIREIPTFERQRDGSFRTWLRQVTVNRVRTYRKQRLRRPVAERDLADGFIENLADPQSELARRWDDEHDRHVFDRLLTVVESDFGSTTWRAFRRFAVDGLPASQVASETGLSENAVIQAKSRILRRLRQEAGGFLD